MPAAKPPEFRRCAVELARLREQPIAKIAQDLGIRRTIRIPARNLRVTLLVMALALVGLGGPVAYAAVTACPTQASPTHAQLEAYSKCRLNAIEAKVDALSKPAITATTTTISAPPVMVTAPAVTVTTTLTTARPTGLRFAPKSFFYASLAGAPLDPNSAAQVSHLGQTITGRYNGVAALNVYDYNVSYFVAPAGTPKVDVQFNDCQGKGYLDANFRAALTGVPIPANAIAATGTDHNLSIYDPATDTLWEFWVAAKDASGWSACWGGRLDAVSTTQGIFPNGLGAAATGISMAGGMVSLADFRSGAINHALYLAVVDARFGAWSWPAQRTDGGSSDPTAVLEGSRLRLDPAVNVNALSLTPLGRMVAKAAQRYGFIVTDKAGAVSIDTESGAPYGAANGGVNPWDQLLGLSTTPSYELFRGFPWDRLQVVAKDWGKAL